MVPTRRKTDYGTVFLHMALVLSFVVLVATGFRIGADDPIAPWLQALDPVLPVQHLWFRHLVAGVVLMATLAAYAVYVTKARLTSRVQLDKARLVAMLRPGRSRFAAVNVLVYWVMMAGLLVEVVTGAMLFAESGRTILSIHLYVTFVCLAALAMHVALHAAYGGLGQLSRILRPAPLHIPADPPDLAELLAEHLAKTAPAATVTSGAEVPLVAPARPQTAEPEPDSDPSPPVRAVHALRPVASARPAEPPVRMVRVQANPFVSGLIVAAAVGSVAVGSEQLTRPTLHIVEIKREEAPLLDGDLSDPVWARSKPVSVLTTQGGDFGGSGQSLVEVRAVHDGEYAYLAIVWEDPTRSLKHQPLVKRGGRWQVAASRDDLLDETRYHDDKLAVLVTRPMMPLIGAAIHLARRPLASRPASSTGRGLHYTDGSIADLWLWRASHAGAIGYVENCHFGGPAPASGADGVLTKHYSGGFAADPGQVSHETNTVDMPLPNDGKGIVPRRLPRDTAAMARAMGRVADGPGESESENSRWWMTYAESLPYSTALDAMLPDGVVVPGILMADEIPDRRDSIRGAARWAAGRWTLEIVRRLHTGSDYDVPLKSGDMMWLAAFDHAEMRHTRHLRPFRLELE